MTTNYGNIDRYLAAKAYRATVSLTERDAGEPRTVGDVMLLEILKRLHAMREIAVRAARLPLSNEERRICQGQIDELKGEIESFAASIPPMAGPSADMGAIDASIARVSDMVTAWEKRTPEGADTVEGTTQNESLREEKKIARWMDSLMRGWGKEIGGAGDADTVTDGGNGDSLCNH